MCFSLNEILAHSHIDEFSEVKNPIDKISRIMAKFLTERHHYPEYSRKKFFEEIDRRIKPKIDFKNYKILKCDIDKLNNKVFIKFVIS